MASPASPVLWTVPKPCHPSSPRSAHHQARRYRVVQGQRGGCRGSQVPGGSSCACAVLCDPGRTELHMADPVGAGSRCCRRLSPSCRCLNPHRGHGTYRVTHSQVLPPLVRPRGLRRTSSFGAESHGLSTRCLRFVARVFPRSTTQDSLPAGGQPLPGGIGVPQDPTKVSATIYITSSFFQA